MLKSKHTAGFAWSVLLVLAAGSANAQTGMKTKTPGATLEVNGYARISVLEPVISMPNAKGIMVTDGSRDPSNNTGNTTGGTLYRSTFIDMLFSEANYKNSSPNNWTNAYVGSKGAQLDFVGEASNGATTVRFSFSVFHFNLGYTYLKVVPEFSASSTGSIVVTPIATGWALPPVFTVTVGGQLFTFNTSYQSGPSLSITAVNTNGYTVTGTFAVRTD